MSIVHAMGVNLHGGIQSAACLLKVHSSAVIANQLAHVVNEIKAPRILLVDFLQQHNET
jgi:hypothetical protein